MEKYKLQDLISIKNGKKYDHLNKGDIPVYGSGGIMTYVDDYLYDGEAVLLPRKGTLNNIMYSKGKLWTVDTMYYALVNEKADPYYLYAYLSQLDLSALDSGSTLPSMTATAYYSVPVKLPNKETQQKIAQILSSLDRKIALNQQINQKLEAMAKTLYDYWFVQFDFPDENGKPYQSSGGEMVWCEAVKREVPKGWELKTIGDYCKSTGGYAFKSSEWTESGNPVIKIKNIQEDGSLNISDIDFVDLTNKTINEKFKVNEGDIVIAMTGATIGKFAIIPRTDNDLYVNQRVGVFKLSAVEKLPFLINALNQDYFRKSIIELSSGAAQPNISNEQINSIELMFPPEKIILKFNEKMIACYKQIIQNRYETQKLTELRDFLLPMLMNGQVGCV